MRPLNKGLRREINALRAKPNPDESEISRWEELRGLSRALHEAKKQRFQQRSCQLLNRLQTLTNELDTLDEKIEMDVSTVHNSIFSDIAFPENTCDRLQSLFEKWQATVNEMDKCIKELEAIRDELDQCIALCDTLLLEPPAPKINPPATTKKVVKAKSSVDLGQFGAEDLLLLRSLLVDIISFYVQKTGRKSNMCSCESILAAHKLLRIPPPESLNRWTNKVVIKRTARKIEQSLNGNPSDEEIAALRTAIDLYSKLTRVLPKKAIETECSKMKARFGFITSIGEFFLNILHPKNLPTLTNIGAEKPPIDPKLVVKLNNHTKRQLESKETFFSLHIFDEFYACSRIDMFCKNVDTLIIIPHSRLVLSTVKDLVPSSPFNIYSRQEVSTELARFGLPELMQLVPPINFIFEDERLTNSSLESLGTL
jgi:hypothetical protein